MIDKRSPLSLLSVFSEVGLIHYAEGVNRVERGNASAGVTPWTWEQQMIIMSMLNIKVKERVLASVILCVCVCIILASFHYACVCVTVLIHFVCMYVCMFSCMCECMYVLTLGGYGSILLGRYWWFCLTASNQCQLTSTIRIGWITVCMGVITMVGRHFIFKTCWFLKWIKFPANNKQSSVILILNDDHDLVINIHSCRSAYVQLITQI